MAQLGVGELMTDLDFVDKIQHVSRCTAVNQFGENVVTEKYLDTVGCVQPASGRVLNRLPENLRVANLLSFWVKGEISTGGAAEGKYTDILVFRKKRFQIQYVFDWTNFGSGYTEGVCVAEVPA